MKKTRLIALLCALCLLVCCFTACKRPDEEWGVTGNTGKQEPGSAQTQPEQKEPVKDVPLAATSLTADLLPSDAKEKKPDDAFIAGQAEFSIDLLKRAYREGEGENTLISPVSVLYALAMTANGADGKTAEEMLSVLGGHSMDDLNAYLNSWRWSFAEEDKGKLKLANSIWMREIAGFKVKDDFLQAGVNYYNAEIYKASFDASTVRDINQWVAGKTDGMIDHLVNDLSDGARMMLINALAFEAEWQKPYEDHQVQNGSFHSADGKSQKAKFMFSKESVYLEDEGAIGILRNYKGGKYSFGALMPEDMDAYLATFSGDTLQKVLQNKKSADVRAYLPKFKTEYSLEMNEVLKEMGMPTAFGRNADFTKMGNHDLLINEVIHKTYIEVDVWGTKAAAVTAVVMDSGSAMPPPEPKIIRLDRPFIYFILDNETNLPIFLGTLTTLE